MQYFVVDTNTGQKYGPADLATLNQWASEGRLTQNTMLEEAATGMQIRAGDLAGLQIAPTEVAPSAPQSSPSEPSGMTGGPSGSSGSFGGTSAGVGGMGGGFQSPYPRQEVGTGALAGYSPGIYFEFIGQAWPYIRQNLGIWVVAVIIWIIVSQLVSQPFSLIANAVGPESGLGLLLTLLGSVMTLAFSGVFSAGMVLFALDIVDGKSPDLARIFEPFKTVGHGVVASFASYLAILIGFVMCIVPGIYLFGRLAFVNVLVADQRMSAGEAFSACWERLGPFAFGMFFVYFVASLMNILGVIACLVGVLVTIPFAFMVLAMHYRVLFPEYSQKSLGLR